MHDYRDLRAAAQSDFNVRGIALFLYDYDRAKQDVRANAELVLHDVPTDYPYTAIEPACYLSEAAAGKLMDDLWQAGIRPTQSKHLSELVEAKQRHIDHLWELVQRLMIMVNRPELEP